MADNKIVLFKIQYLGKKIWCRCSKEELSYSFIIETGKKKFGISDEVGSINLYDKDGVLVDEEFIDCFFDMDNDAKILVLCTENTEHLTKQSTSFTTETLTNSSSSRLSPTYSFLITPDENLNDNTLFLSMPSTSTEPLTSTQPLTFTQPLTYQPQRSPQPLIQSESTSGVCTPPPTLNKFGNITAENLKTQIIAKHGNKNVFEEYERINCLTNQTRKMLVNTVCDLIVERYGLSIPTKIKEEYAKCIIEIFPNLRDPYSSKGYEIFFNPQKHDGFLAWRLKTLSRKNPEKRKKTNHQAGSLTKQQKTEDCDKDAQNINLNEIIEELKLAHPKTDNNLIFKKMADTLKERRKLPMENVLINFPRFIDTPGLIEQDFSLLYPNKPTLSERFEAYCDKILDIYAKTSSQVNSELLVNEEDNDEVWPKEIRAILALLQILRPTARGKKCPNGNTVQTATQKLLVFKKNNVPLNGIMKENFDNKQPRLIIEGLSMGRLTSFHICVDQKLIPLEKVTSPVEAIDVLFMCHFVFDIEYDFALTNFWTFIQVFFYDIESSNITPKIRELRAKLSL